MIRLKCALLFLTAAVALSTTGCYTRMGFGDPYGSAYYDDGYRSDYWTEVYYVYVPYDPWGPYPGAHWWYEDYHGWHHPPVHHDYDDWDEVSGRYGWDRGPGAPSTPSTPRVGVASGGSGGSAPSTTGETQSVESKNPARQDGQAPARTEEKKPKEEPEKKRRSWGR